MKIFSPAKINLFLQVLGKRSDGYHDLMSLMCCIGLYDTVSLTFGVKNIAVSCHHPGVPEDDKNLAFGAAHLFLKTLNKNEGVKIIIQKQIPVAAGLGGGSSNAAAVFLGLNRYYGYPFSTEELMSMGLSIGADVPFFIFQKPAIASGIGEKLEAFEGPLPYHILLIYPGFNVSTAETYQNLNFGLTNDQKKPTSISLKRNRFDPAVHLANDLERVTAAKYPEIGLAKEKLMNLGAIGALMSGSGPTVFGLFDNAETAKSAGQSLSQDKDLRLFLVDPILEADPIFIGA
jgi:4-diphosphocytidyl-2-C-methyl-D-erythritol kinase